MLLQISTQPFIDPPLLEGFDGGGRLLGLEWTMQRNDQLPEENQTRGNDFLRDSNIAIYPLLTFL